MHVRLSTKDQCVLTNGRIQGLKRSGVSGPAVSLRRASRICSSVGCMAGSLARLCSLLGVLAQVKQFLTYIPFPPDIYPVALGHGGQRPSLLCQPLRGIGAE